MARVVTSNAVHSDQLLCLHAGREPFVELLKCPVPALRKKLVGTANGTANGTAADITRIAGWETVPTSEHALAQVGVGKCTCRVGRTRRSPAAFWGGRGEGAGARKLASQSGCSTNACHPSAACATLLLSSYIHTHAYTHTLMFFWLPPHEIPIYAPPYIPPQALANQPVVALVHAAPDWADYAGGAGSKSASGSGSEIQVYDGACSSDPADANHAVLVVGMYADAWVIRNSWGRGWGYGGHMYLRRGVNRCGIANLATYPVLRPAPAARPGKLAQQAACSAAQVVS